MTFHDVSSVPRKPLIQSVASRTAARFGVRFYNLLYGEMNLQGRIESITPGLEVEVELAQENGVEDLLRRLSGLAHRYCLIAREVGSSCWLARHQEQIVGYSWLNRRQVHLLGWPLFELPESGAYTYNSYVWPEYRGCRIFQLLSEGIYRRLQAEGYTFCCNLVDRSNAASIGARRRFGVVYQPAPILKLPGMEPFVVGRSPELGVTVKDQLTASTGHSSSFNRV